MEHKADPYKKLLDPGTGSFFPRMKGLSDGFPKRVFAPRISEESGPLTHVLMAAFGTDRNLPAMAGTEPGRS